ncbi:MAG: rRNA maturation RNase YbeY [Bacteroidia bacterium]
MAISFTSQHSQFKLRQTSKLKRWIAAVAENEKRQTGDLSYIFTDDESLLKINKQYLHHNTYTDIITFDYSDHKTVSGDIFISIDRVKENAVKFGAAFEDELLRVIIHGVLHLCGYKDKTKADSDKMRLKENAAIALYKKRK